ncbi:MAG: hypothetical protein ABIM74_08215 [candidate division WOR-3 bacterium]
MKRLLSAIILMVLGACGNPGGQTPYNYPERIVDSLEVSGEVWDIGVSGGVLYVLFKDTLGSWRVGFYNNLDLSELANLAPGNDGLGFSSSAVGIGKLYVSFAGAYSDSAHIVVINLTGYSVDTELLAPGAWGPMAMGSGKLYYLSDSNGILYCLDPSTGAVTESQSQITPLVVGDIIYVTGYGFFVTDQHGNTLYLIDELGILLDSWGVDNSPQKIAWDGYRALLTAGPGLCPVSLSVGKLPTLIFPDAKAVAVSPDTQIILVGYRDGVASVSVNELEDLGTAPTPFSINLLAPAGPARAFASAWGKSKVYLLE